MADFKTWVKDNKALWTRIYDDVITPSFEAEWKKRQTEHDDDLKKYEDEKKSLLTHISNEAVTNARLHREKQELQAKVEELQRSAKASDQNKEQVSASAYNELVRKHDALTKRFSEITKKSQYLEKKSALVMQKNKEMKDSIRQWQDYIDRQPKAPRSTSHPVNAEGAAKSSSGLDASLDGVSVPSSPSPLIAKTGEVSAGPEGLPIPISSEMDDPKTPQPLANTKQSRSTTIGPNEPAPTPHQDAEFDVPGDNTPTVAVDSRTSTVSQPLANTGAAGPSSSQTTIEEAGNQRNASIQNLDRDLDDDIPLFVSARSVNRKRKRHTTQDIPIYADRSSDGTFEKPVRVKEEPNASPPRTSRKFRRTDTIDLDAPTPNVLQTPRRKRKTISTYADATGMLRHQRSNSEPCSQPVKLENTVTALSFHDLPLETVNPKVLNGDPRALSEPNENTQTGNTVLRMLDPNTVSISTPNQQVPGRSRRADEAYNMLAESGEDAPFSTLKDRLPPSMARAQLNKKMRLSKNQSTPIRIAASPSASTAHLVKTESCDPPILHRKQPAPSKQVPRTLPKPRQELTPGNRPAWTMKPLTTSASSSSSSRRTRPSPEKRVRLRDKPVEALRAEDFKPNPAQNRGYSHAFSETIRKRADRLCLPGCTKPNCCGSTFRAFAEAQAPLSSSQEESLLEDYLGDAYDDMRLTQMATEERAELVLQARTKKMADTVGKHRETFERRRTPPGFWRVDFPTTQEMEEDRAKSREMEREIVQERWREAQRRNGQWIFRDE